MRVLGFGSIVGGWCRTVLSMWMMSCLGDADDTADVFDGCGTVEG